MSTTSSRAQLHSWERSKRLAWCTVDKAIESLATHGVNQKS